MKLPLTLALDKDGLPRIFSDPAAALEAAEPSSDLFLVELQGQLEVQLEQEGEHHHLDSSVQAGQRIGRLDMSVPSRPTLLIGHHRLIGQVVKLNTPLAILKHTLPPKQASTPSSLPPPPPTSSPLPARRHNNGTDSLTHDGEEETTALSSPLKRSRSESEDVQENSEVGLPPSKRTASQAKDELGENDNPAPSTPFPSRLAERTATTGNGLAPPQGSSPSLAPPPSSALTSRTVAPHTPFNVAEVRSGKHEIVGIIRNKILFSKRPEPVVKLDEHSEEE